MGRYLDLADNALADLGRGRSGRLDSPQAADPPSTYCDKSDVSDKTACDVSPCTWSNPDDPAVQAARLEAARLGVLGKTARDVDVGPRWIVGPELDRLPEPLQGLVMQRPGWTAANWSSYLLRRARLCDERHRDLAALYEQAAQLLAPQQRSALL